MMRPEILMLAVLIGCILLAAFLDIYQPAPAPAPAAPAPLDYAASLWADCHQLDLARAGGEEIEHPDAGAAR